MLVFALSAAVLTGSNPLRVLAETTNQEALNFSALILAVLAIIGAAVPSVVGIFSKKVRGHSDIRDDASAENERLARAADTAIDLVAEARQNAAQAVEMVRGSLALAQGQIASLNELIGEYKTLLAEAKLHSAATAAEHDERVAALEAKVAERTAERDELQQKIDEKQRELDAAEEVIREMTLSPEKLRQLVTAETPVQAAERNKFETIVFPPATDSEEQ